MIFLNGRFLTQRLTGVQRVAHELIGALDALEDAPAMRLLMPPGALAPPLARIECVAVAGPRGQLWEQLALPRAARGGVLVNLGNTAPLWAGARQAVLIHDAGVFDTPGSYSRSFRLWYRTLQRALIARGARVLTVSEFSRRRLKARLGVEAAVMPLGAQHILRPTADASILARSGLGPGGYALTVGSPAAHKNLDALQEAAAMLAQRGLSLAAVGAADGAVFQAASGTQGPGAVALGRVTDAELRALYENALCLVFPSRYEGFGLPPLEAMACGCPVIAAESGAVPEVCGEAALWFDSDGPRRPAAALFRLLETPGLADELRAQGHVRAARFTWRATAERLLACIPEAAP